MDSKKMKEQESEMMAENDMRTLKGAEEIKQDPKRMKAVEECMKKEKKAMDCMSKMFPSMNKDMEEGE